MTIDCHLLRFAFSDHPVRTLRHDGELWLVAKDACHALGMENPRVAIRRLGSALKGSSVVNTPGGAQALNTVSERGVHWLGLTARTPAAARFREWVTSNVVPFLGGPAPLVLDDQHPVAKRGLIAVPLTELEFRLLSTLHGRKRPAFADWLASEAVGISGGALHGLVHRLRKKLAALDYGIVNCRAGDGESGAYMLSDLSGAAAKGRAA